MKQLLMGAIVGIFVGIAVVGAAPSTPLRSSLEEFQITASQDTPLIIPPSYGRLVTVAINSEVQHLYFQDDGGAIRVVSVGPRGAIQKSRQALQLLSNDVYVIERKPFLGAVIKHSTTGTAE